MPLKIILWALALEPLLLAAVALFLRRYASLDLAPSFDSGDILLAVFAAASLALAWASFAFASGRLPLKDSDARPPAPIPIGHMIIATVLASAPGVLGFIYYLLLGEDWALLVFNLGGFILAARHILNFNLDRL